MLLVRDVCRLSEEEREESKGKENPKTNKRGICEWKPSSVILKKLSPLPCAADRQWAQTMDSSQKDKTFFHYCFNLLWKEQISPLLHTSSFKVSDGSSKDGPGRFGPVLLLEVAFQNILHLMSHINIITSFNTFLSHVIRCHRFVIHPSWCSTYFD